MEVSNRRFKVANFALVSAVTLALAGCGDESLNSQVGASPDSPSTPSTPTIPSSPVPPSGTDKVIFDNSVNAKWPAWDCCGGTTPIHPVELDEYGLTTEFRIGAEPAVLGYVRAEGLDGVDVSDIAQTGVLEFEIKLRNSPGDNVQWIVKIESNGGDQNNNGGEAVELNIPAPKIGMWTKVAVSLADLSNQGLDLTSIDKVLISPAWGQGEGAIYRVDNVRLVDSGDSDPGTPDDSVTPVESDEGYKLNLGAVLEDFEGAFSEQQVENPSSTLLPAGTLIKTVKPVGAQPWAGTTLGDILALDITPERSIVSLWVYSAEAGIPVLLKVENAADAAQFAEVLVQTSVVSEWEKLEFDFTNLNNGVLDPNYIFDKKSLFFDFMADAADKEFYWADMTLVEADEVVEPPVDPEEPPVNEGESIVIFNDSANPAWVAWDCCGGTTPSVITDSDDAYGAVTEFNIVGATVVGFNSREMDGAVGGSPVDVMAWKDTGTVSFDLKLTNDNGAMDWKFKVESVGGAPLELSLPEVPTLDVWKRFTFNLSDLAEQGVNLSAIDLLMMFPAWGTGDGASYVVDNVQFSSVGNTAPEEPEQPEGPVLPPVDVEGNVVVNGDFETESLDPWYSIGGGSVTLDSGAARLQAGNGAESRIKANGIGAGVINPNQTITVSFSYRGEAVDGGVANAIIHFIGDGVTGTEVINMPAPTAEWQSYSQEMVVSAGTSAGLDFTIGGVCGAVATCSVDLYLDNIAVVPEEGTGETPDNPEEGPILPPDDGTGNLIANGDFTDDLLTPWYQVGGGSVVVQDQAVTVAATNGNEARIKAEKIGQGVLTAGQAVTLSFQAKGFAGPGAVANGLLYTTSPAGVSKTDNFDISSLTTVWQEYSYDFVIGNDPEWGVDLAIGAVCGAVDGCQAQVSFDNVRLEVK
ncbi:carbohydrate binding domain-containing protein [Vibrio comitans]